MTPSLVGTTAMQLRWAMFKQGLFCRLHAWLAGSLQSRRLWTEQPHACMPHLPCCASPVLLGESMEARCCWYSHTPTG